MRGSRAHRRTWLLVWAIAAMATGLAACVQSEGDSSRNAMEGETPERLGEMLLSRFATSLDLQRLSVKVEDLATAATPGRKVLRFDYYTPVGDRSFLVPIARSEAGWRAAASDIEAVEARFAR